MMVLPWSITEGTLPSVSVLAAPVARLNLSPPVAAVTRLVGPEELLRTGPTLDSMLTVEGLITAPTVLKVGVPRVRGEDTSRGLIIDLVRADILASDIT